MIDAWSPIHRSDQEPSLADSSLLPIDKKFLVGELHCVESRSKSNARPSTEFLCLRPDISPKKSRWKSYPRSTSRVEIPLYHNFQCSVAFPPCALRPQASSRIKHYLVMYTAHLHITHFKIKNPSLLYHPTGSEIMPQPAIKWVSRENTNYRPRRSPSSRSSPKPSLTRKPA